MAKDDIGDLINGVVLERLQSMIDNSEIELDVDKINAKYQDLYITLIKSGLLEKIADDGVETIESLMYEKSIYLRLNDDAFHARVNRMYFKAFAASDSFYIAIGESAERYRDFAKEKCELSMIPMFNAQLIIHARALQMYLEILCLLRNGFADGAMARWRSLYELSAVSSFIRRYGAHVADEFIKSIGHDDKKRNWAKSAECFSGKSGKDSISISAIIQESGLNYEKWKKEYDLGNKVVHADPEATFARIGSPSQSEHVLLIGKSDYNLGRVAFNAAVSLSIITMNFFTVPSIYHIDSYTAALTFHKWVEVIKKYYDEVDELYFSRINAKSWGKV